MESANELRGAEGVWTQSVENLF